LVRKRRIILPFQEMPEPPIRAVLRRQRNTRVLLGEVTGIDPVARRAIVDTVGRSTHQRPAPHS
jgi:hypothetical protein